MRSPCCVVSVFTSNWKKLLMISPKKILRFYNKIKNRPPVCPTCLGDWIFGRWKINREPNSINQSKMFPIWDQTILTAFHFFLSLCYVFGFCLVDLMRQIKIKYMGCEIRWSICFLIAEKRCCGTDSSKSNVSMYVWSVRRIKKVQL